MSVKGINRIAIIGTGAVGGYYGAKLAAAGNEVHFLARSDADVIKAQGLTIESLKSDDIHLKDVNVYSNASDMPICDVVLITLKTTANKALSGILKSVVGESTIICSLQNGYGLEQALEDEFPDNKVLGGLCFICSQKIKPGVIQHQDFGSIRFAGADDESLQRVVELFTDAGIPTQTSDSLEQARWEKLVWNVPFNGLSVILDATTKEMLDDPKSRALIHSIMMEVIAAAKAHGCELNDAFAVKLMELTDGMSPYFPSMKGDFENCRPMEIQAIYDSVIQSAKSKGVAMPQTTMLSQLLSYMDHG
ncbi:putative 2-dehydropantoate 2-reductase [Litoribrevibacter albus]|uniref:2-dehydropantoate 2-reductase n=1 Tax=Litoribrevibacter albus TaxID=1473156 RepID=A0AA37W7V5_9GAMM|nr:putative 2-dehydropantoate 2-reductase [Litoribrevibacter albus]GLQ31828.1 2-dehydropantoate 2-reductase [Litoribrevibacter albus]